MTMTANGEVLRGNNGADQSSSEARGDELSSRRALVVSPAQAKGEACVVCGENDAPEGKKVPAHTGHPGAWSCAECHEAAARRTGRPWWQNRPCDDWCMRSHPVRDNGPDRVCISAWSAYVPVSLLDQERDPHDGEAVPNFVGVYLQRDQREIEPRVSFVVPGKPQLTELDLTLAEGRQLAEALSHAVGLAGGVR